MTAPDQEQVASAVIKIGTRGSPLAMAQAYQTKDRLQVSLQKSVTLTQLLAGHHFVQLHFLSPETIPVLLVMACPMCKLPVKVS